jgi:hypothetical protein
MKTSKHGSVQRRKGRRQDTAVQHPSVITKLVAGMLSGCILASLPAMLRAKEPAAALMPPGIVSGIKVQPDQAPDCSSLKAIVASVTRGCTNNDDKAVALFNFVSLSHFLPVPPLVAGGAGISALEEINGYGWGDMKPVLAALGRTQGWDWRFTEWGPHTISPVDPPDPGGEMTVEMRYDNRWHYFDAEFYAWMPDANGGRTIAGEEDLAQNVQALTVDAFFYDRNRNLFYARDGEFVRNGNKPNWFSADIRPTGDAGWKRYTRMLPISGGVQVRKEGRTLDTFKGINLAGDDYATDVNLAPGFALENTWDHGSFAECQESVGEANDRTKIDAKFPHRAGPAFPLEMPHKGYYGFGGGHKATRNNPGYGLVVEPYLWDDNERTYGIGSLVFSPDFSDDAFLQSFAATENVKYANKLLVPAKTGEPAFVVVRLASPYLLAKVTGEANGADTVEVSVDNGKTFTAASLNSPNLNEAVKGRKSVLLKIGFKEALKSLTVTALVQNNPWALPYLSPGRNKAAVSVAEQKALGKNRLVVTYAYRLGFRTNSLEQIYAEGKPVARQCDAQWSETVTYAQRIFTAGDLPATFEIDCPTPKGMFPVYPRMLFVRREVLAPSSSPLPLPAGAVEASPDPNGELLPLHNPFLIGTRNAKAATIK